MQGERSCRRAPDDLAAVVVGRAAANLVMATVMVMRRSESRSREQHQETDEEEVLHSPSSMARTGIRRALKTN